MIPAMTSDGRAILFNVPRELLVSLSRHIAVFVAEQERLRVLAHDFGQLLAASYLAGKLDPLIAQLENQERDPK